MILRAGPEPWPRLWQNFRATRATELCDEYPSHLAAKWLRHSELIANRHYRQVREEHYQRAISKPTGSMPGESQSTDQNTQEHFGHKSGHIVGHKSGHADEGKEMRSVTRNENGPGKTGAITVARSALHPSAKSLSGGQGTRTLNRQVGA